MEKRYYEDEKITVTKSSMPSFEEYIEKIKPLWETKWLTNMGRYHKELETELKAFLDVPYVSLMVNGHMALEMTIQAMGFPEGGEVITTPFTFISTTHAIVRNKLQPVFCDIKLEDYTIDEKQIEALITDKTVAIVPVHVYGNVCNIEQIDEIAKKYGLKVIYDAAHAFGETYKGTGIGNYGNASIFSFHATKVFNTIEGGAATFSEPALYERLYNLKNFGIRGEELVIDVGANAKMNELCAIMGICNLPYVKLNIATRKEKAEVYLQCLANCEHIVLPSFEQNGVCYNYAYFPVRFTKVGLRNRVYTKLRTEEIYARKYFYPLTSEAECFGEKYKKLLLLNAREVANNILVLPLYPELDNVSISRICEIIDAECAN